MQTLRRYVLVPGRCEPTLRAWRLRRPTWAEVPPLRRAGSAGPHQRHAALGRVTRRPRSYRAGCIRRHENYFNGDIVIVHARLNVVAGPRLVLEPAQRDPLEADTRAVGNEIPEPEVGVVAENNGGDAPTPGVAFHACFVPRLLNVVMHIIRRRPERVGRFSRLGADSHNARSSLRLRRAI